MKNAQKLESKSPEEAITQMQIHKVTERALGTTEILNKPVIMTVKRAQHTDQHTRLLEVVETESI